MLILSNRGLRTTLPTKQPAYLDLDTFADTLYMRDEDGEWIIASAEAIKAKSVLLVFHGYNNPSAKWADSGVTTSRFFDSVFKAHGYKGEVIGCLWPGRGENIFEKALFSEARINASRSALTYTPFVLEMLSNGVSVSAIGHSCGGYLASLLAWNIGKYKKQLKAVILMEAAMRQSEFSQVMLDGAKTWLCCHSAQDMALRFMQKDFVDEYGWLEGIKRLLTRRNDCEENIIGMHGIQYVDDVRVRNYDLTNIIAEEHSGGHHVPQVMKLVAETMR